MTASSHYLPEGLPIPAQEPGGLDQPFWDGAFLGELRIQRCKRCRTWQWGPEWICHKCRSFEMSWEAIAPQGFVYSWTRVWHPVHPALRTHGPYLLVLVELPQAGGVRLLGNLLGDPTQLVHVGDRLEAVFEQHPHPEEPYTLVQWRVRR